MINRREKSGSLDCSRVRFLGPWHLNSMIQFVAAKQKECAMKSLNMSKCKTISQRKIG